jgi:sugar lactone lactonase YvrE
MGLDSAGNLYVADSGNHRVRKVDPQGNVTTLAGNGTEGFVDGTGGRAGTAEFSSPRGVTVDAHGTVYVADTGNGSVRAIDAQGNVTTLAGHPTAETLPDGGISSADGTGGPTGTAVLQGPAGLAIDAQGNVLVADTFDCRIRRIDSGGNVTTVAGNATDTIGYGPGSFADGTGGPNGTAEFSYPSGVVADPQGNIYVADSGNNRIRKIDPQGNVTTLAGNGTADFADGAGGPDGVAEFTSPLSVALASDGSLLVADTGNNRIRRVDAQGNTTTVVGQAMFFQNTLGALGPNGPGGVRDPDAVVSSPSGELFVLTGTGLLDVTP